jgi:hypothetical protein
MIFVFLSQDTRSSTRIAAAAKGDRQSCRDSQRRNSPKDHKVANGPKFLAKISHCGKSCKVATWKRRHGVGMVKEGKGGVDLQVYSNSKIYIRNTACFHSRRTAAPACTAPRAAICTPRPPQTPCTSRAPRRTPRIPSAPSSTPPGSSPVPASARPNTSARTQKQPSLVSPFRRLRSRKLRFSNMDAWCKSWRSRAETCGKRRGFW